MVEMNIAQTLVDKHLLQINPDKGWTGSARDIDISFYSISSNLLFIDCKNFSNSILFDKCVISTTHFRFRGFLSSEKYPIRIYMHHNVKGDHVIKLAKSIHEKILNGEETKFISGKNCFGDNGYLVIIKDNELPEIKFSDIFKECVGFSVSEYNINIPSHNVSSSGMCLDLISSYYEQLDVDYTKCNLIRKYYTKRVVD